MGFLLGIILLSLQPIKFNDMPIIIRNILALIIGLVVGSFVNMGIILISNFIIPAPAGADLTTEEGLIKAMELMQPKHFIMFGRLALFSIGSFVQILYGDAHCVAVFCRRYLHGYAFAIAALVQSHRFNFGLFSNGLSGIFFAEEEIVSQSLVSQV
jgi:hypothetical protein